MHACMHACVFVRRRPSVGGAPRRAQEVWQRAGRIQPYIHCMYTMYMYMQCIHVYTHVYICVVFLTRRCASHICGTRTLACVLERLSRLGAHPKHEIHFTCLFYLYDYFACLNINNTQHTRSRCSSAPTSRRAASTCPRAGAPGS